MPSKIVALQSSRPGPRSRIAERSPASDREVAALCDLDKERMDAVACLNPLTLYKIDHNISVLNAMWQ